MENRITMATVAKAAGVHQTTVSLALRNDPRLPSATRDRIQRVARDLGYRPNPMVSALISARRKGLPTGKGSVLAFLTSHTSPDGWRHSRTNRLIFDKLKRHAGDRGYLLEEFWLKEPNMTPGRMRKILLHRGIRGIVVCPMEGVRDALDFDFSDFSAVALGYTLKSPLLDHVAPDYFSNMGLAVRNSLKSGSRRILYLTDTAVDQRVNHLYLGCYLAEKKLHPKVILEPLLVDRWTPAVLRRKLTACRPDTVLVSMPSEKKEILPMVKKDTTVVCLSHYDNSTGHGIFRRLNEEAEVTISFVTGRVERAQFGLPTQPRSILIAGAWECDSRNDR